MKKISLQDIKIFENENYIIINKPPFFSTLDDKGSEQTILLLAKTENQNYQVAHRIDKETSGALVIAKNADAYRNLSIQFEKRQVDKIYHAVAEGIHNIDGLKIELPLSISARGNVKVDHRGGKPSQTMVKTEKAFKHYTLIKCKPLTGRMHQIRVHLASIGASLVQDELYGGKQLFLSSLKRKFNLKKETEEQPLIKRFALHAYSISFKDLDGKTIEIVAPYPKDFDVLIKQLEKWD